MAQVREPVRLHGFNNLTKQLSFNLYDFVSARTDKDRESYVRYLYEHFSGARITAILAKIAEIIDADVLNVSTQDYDPWGASSLLLLSDLGHASVGVHLTKSHVCAHTYPDLLDPRGLCTFRVDIDIATCGTIVPLRALDTMFESFESDVVFIDYVVRGFTRDTEGRHVYLDHTVGSIRDFIDPAILADYHCEDLALPDHNIWQTKMLRTKLDPPEYFAPGTDLGDPANLDQLELIRREMTAIFHGRP